MLGGQFSDTQGLVSHNMELLWFVSGVISVLGRLVITLYTNQAFPTTLHTLLSLPPGSNLPQLGHATSIIIIDHRQFDNRANLPKFNYFLLNRCRKDGIRAN
jgi:hypothetical protein